MGMIVKPLYTPRYVPTGNEVAVFETSKGTIRVRLFGKDAPVTVGNFVELAQKGFYDHQNFHGRVEGDVVVGGCPVT
ncbi:peptidylprolyl isomerase, partial [Gordonibacter pamelaeae]